MNTTLAVQVTEEDIEKGCVGDTTSCAANLAVARALRNRGLAFEGLAVYSNVGIKHEREWVDVSAFSQEMFTFAKSFDAGEAKPTEFLLFFE